MFKILQYLLNTCVEKRMMWVLTHKVMFCEGEILQKNIVFLLQKQLSSAFVNVPCHGKVDFTVSEEDLG